MCKLHLLAHDHLMRIARSASQHVTLRIFRVHVEKNASFQPKISKNFEIGDVDRFFDAAPRVVGLAAEAPVGARSPVRPSCVQKT